MKLALLGRSKFTKHEMNVAEVNHGRGGFWFALIVFAIAPSTTIPRIRAGNVPDLLIARGKPVIVTDGE